MTFDMSPTDREYDTYRELGIDVPTRFRRWVSNDSSLSGRAMLAFVETWYGHNAA